MSITSFESISRQVLMTGDPVTGKDGRLYLDGVSTPVNLSEAIAEAIYIGEIFRNGQSVTSKYTANAKVGDAVKVPLEIPFPSTSRTLALGGRRGTEGNSGIINRNAPMMPAEDEFIVFMNQVNDQPILFPDMAKNWLPLNQVAKRVASYSKTVVEDRSASILAEILAYSIYRALNGANNIKTIDTTAEYAYSTLLNSLNTALDNGDSLTGAHTYPTEGRCIIARSSLVNNMFNTKSGIILTGSDLAQTMLKEYKFDTSINERDYVGNAYRGRVMQFDIQCAVDYIWTLAEKYLGLAAGDLDNVYGVAVSFDTTAVSENIDLGVKMVDNSNNPRGLVAQPLNCWGHEGFRVNQLICAPDFTTTNLTSMGFTDTERRYPCAPSEVFATAKTDKILVPVYSADGETIVGYREVANVAKPNGGNVQNSLTRVTLTVKSGSTAITGATVTVANSGMTPDVTEVGNGVYTFNVGQNTAATVTIAKTGYTTATQAITTANTKTTSFAVTKSIVTA